jgi:hypothetical protein
MMNSTPQRLGRFYRVLRRAHHIYVVPLFIAMFFGFLRFVVWMGMSLDRIFFPSLRKKKANRPIVLVGNPRTGTTFLQRFLSDNGFGAGMELFLMLYPSLFLQAILKPILPVLEKLSPAKYHSTEAHHTSLTSVETDDVALLFRYMDGFFFYGFFLAFDEEDLWENFDPKVRDTSKRDFDWLNELWTRSLVKYGGQRNVAKLFSLSARLPQFLERFPEAQVLYMARDPLEIIPSTMSLVTGPLDRAFGFWSKPEAERRRYLDRLYAGVVMILRRFHEDWVAGKIDKSKVYIVRYDRMMGEFEQVMDEMCDFLGHEMTPELKATVDALGVEQRGYKSGHKYELEKYGLKEEQIRSDCAFFYDTFLPPIQIGETVTDPTSAVE